MAHWAVVYPAERLDEERLFSNDSRPLRLARDLEAFITGAGRASAR